MYCRYCGVIETSGETVDINFNPLPKKCHNCGKKLY